MSEMRMAGTPPAHEQYDWGMPSKLMVGALVPFFAVGFASAAVTVGLLAGTLAALRTVGKIMPSK